MFSFNACRKTVNKRVQGMLQNVRNQLISGNAEQRVLRSVLLRRDSANRSHPGHHRSRHSVANDHLYTKRHHPIRPQGAAVTITVQ
jgi:hypothetical protein